MFNVNPNDISPFMEALGQERTPDFNLEDIPDFPYDEYQSNLSRYTELWNWFSGVMLDEEVESSSNKKVDLYPVRVNPLVAAVYKHVYTLFGEIDMNDRPPVFPRVVINQNTEEEKERARYTEETLYRVWSENNPYSTMIENATISQVYGGCVFRLRWDPTDPFRTVPVTIENVHPSNFVGIPKANDMWSLSDAWFVRPINPREAAASGVTIDEDSVAWFVEHITPTRIEAFINNDPVKANINGEWVDVNGVNPFGFVPVVYIPHLRIFGFYGDSMITNLRGIVKELNLRIADYGDAVNVDAHTYLGMRHVQGTPTVMQIAPGINVINLQGMPALTGNESEPDLFAFQKAAASSAMQDMYGILYDQFRRDAYLPAIADGEDEGSQRSGLTLAMRMWPLVSHTNTERLFWTSGLNILNKMLLRMLLVKGVAGITPEHALMQIRQQWYPPLPRDREQQINEVVARVGANLGSPEHLIEMLGDVEDPVEEVERILDFLKRKAEIDAEAKAAAAPAPVQSGSKAQKKSPPDQEPEDDENRSE